MHLCSNFSDLITIWLAGAGENPNPKHSECWLMSHWLQAKMKQSDKDYVLQCCQLDWVHSGCLAFLLMLSDFAKGSFLKDLDSSSTSLLNKQLCLDTEERVIDSVASKNSLFKNRLLVQRHPKTGVFEYLPKKGVKVQIILKANFSTYCLIFCLTCHGWLGIKNQLSIYVTYFCWMPSLH